MKLTRKAVVAILIMILLCCTGCGKQEKENTVTSLADMKDRALVVGMPSDYDVSEQILAVCPNAILECYDDALLGMSAVSSGRLDAYACSDNFVFEALETGKIENIRMLEEPIEVFRCGIGLSKTGPVENYEERVNACIAELKADGTLDDMNRRWFIDGDEQMPEIPAPEAPSGTIFAATFGKAKPNSYLKDGEITGFDVELAYRIAAYLNCEITWETAEYPALLLGLSTGRYDLVAASLFITEEREDNVSFSDSYSERNIVVVIRSDPADGKTADTFASRFADGFRKTFIAEHRWQTILKGFAITLEITVLGFVLANLFGVIYCAQQMSGRKVWRCIAEIYSRIILGTPIIVLLMFLFYVIFGRTNVSGVAIAILGFGLASGASLGQQFYGAISGVDRGQSEAALSLGFTRYEAFTGIVLPQAVRTLLPGYFSELISLMKGTSIVGYVAVIDLTKVSDMIRSSTYDAFFPLFSVALIYFLIAFLLLSLLKSLMKKLAPKRVNGKGENS